ncbi:transposase [Trinickia dabaoshanensis]|uniref:Transposase n=1 Tax=Trinickia dabaoshanensis TaxID=564714 RepID=A0A2N7VH41_9BURK|nr:DDE-type integrase/transposase/recombinase [Trinickia dabaoshanensis]PMS16461.1 transposase [Trinickia dabaoshanensis]
MTVYALERGLVIQVGDAQWQVQRVLDATHVQLEHARTGRIRRERISKLAADITAGRVKVLRDAEPASDRERHDASKVICIASVPERYQHDYARAYEYVRHLLRKGISKGQRSRITEAISTFSAAIGDSHPPSSSTVMRWMRCFESSGGNPSCLISGNVRRKRQPRIPSEVRRVIDHLLARHYFRKHGSTLRAVHDRVVETLAKDVEAGRITSERAQVSASTIRRIAYEVAPYDRDRLRIGTAEANHKWRFSKPGRYATRPLERVEMDHTLLDIWVVDDRWGIPLGRPTITFLVCSYSGYILGFYVSFEGETLARTVQSIKLAIQPKDAITEAAKLSNQWHAMGLWETLIVDNALSVHSKRLQFIVNELCCDLEYCPVRMPWFKATVERSLGELTRQLPAQGRPQKPGRQPDPIDPRVTACITFSDLCLGVLQWVVDVHPFEINARKNSRPIDLFLDGLDECPAPSFLESTLSLDVLAGIQKTVTVRHDGVTHEWLSYVSDELGQMRREVGTNFRANMAYNPYELGSAFVQHPRTAAWVQVFAKDQEYAVGLSQTQHRLIRAATRERLTHANAEEVLRKSRLALQERWASAIATGKRLKRSPRDFALFQQVSAVSIGPSSASSGQIRPFEKFASDDDPPVMKKPIPSFETFIGDAP